MANEHRGQEKVWHFNGKRHNGGGEGGQASNFLEGKLSIGKMIEPKKKSEINNVVSYAFFLGNCNYWKLCENFSFSPESLCVGNTSPTVSPSLSISLT